MDPLEQKIASLEAKIARLEGLIAERGGNIILTKTVQIDGILSADRLYTQRSGSYAELTT